MSIHIVQQGEHLLRIALQYGYQNYHVIWDDPQNAQLKRDRGDPNVLLPGDSLFIPSIERRTEDRPTGKAHRFQIDRATLLLRIVLDRFEYLPLEDIDCELEIGGIKFPFHTGGDGKIEQIIPATAEDGTLRIAAASLQMPLKIGHLDPVDQPSGQTARLTNLGYLFPTTDAPDALMFQMAIEEFQCDQQIDLTGVMDDATQGKLLEVYGS